MNRCPLLGDINRIHLQEHRTNENTQHEVEGYSRLRSLNQIAEKCPDQRIDKINETERDSCDLIGSPEKNKDRYRQPDEDGKPNDPRVGKGKVKNTRSEEHT